MRQSSFIKVEAALALILMVSGPVHAQSIQGELGYQSRASIRIEASVMPRFVISGASESPGISSNAPALRYSLLVKGVQSAAPASSGTSGEPAAPAAGQPLLMLVVPD